MYAQFFGLQHEPFSIAPDPRYLFMSEQHREALAHLLYGLGAGGGFVLLTGEIGAGKTTVCRCFLEQIPKRCNVAYIFNPKLSVTELLKSVCDEFGVPVTHGIGGVGAPASVKDYVDPLNRFLLKTHAVGQNNVLIIDEAQALSAEVLEQLRLLTNLETNERKLLQIILIGQPELRDMLARPELEQLAQRVTARFHLDALSEAETQHYIRHRLSVAGLTTAMPFDRRSMQRIHRLTRGVPRRINLLCSRALLGAYAEGKPKVDASIVRKAAREVLPQRRGGWGWRGGVGAWLRPARGVSSGVGAQTSREPASGPAVVSPGRSVDRVPAVAGVLTGLAIMGVLAWVVQTQWRSGPGAPSTVGAALAGSAGAASRPTAASASMAASSAVATASQASSASVATSGSSPGSASGTATASALPASAATTVVSVTHIDLDPPGRPAWRDESDAWRELAPGWKLAIGNDESDPCATAHRHQVQCYRGITSLDQIRQLGRPGILSMQDERGRTAYVLLTALGEQTATLRIGGVAQKVPLRSLAALWRGEFATFWRAPPGYTGALAGTTTPKTAAWLNDKLATLDVPPPPVGRHASPEAALKARVAAFQAAQGLKPDGIAGPATFMQINRALHIDEPRLLIDSAPAT